MQQEGLEQTVVGEDKVRRNALGILELAHDLAKNKGIPEVFENTQPAIIAREYNEQCTETRFENKQVAEATLFWTQMLGTAAIPRDMTNLTGVSGIYAENNAPVGHTTPAQRPASPGGGC